MKIAYKWQILVALAGSLVRPLAADQPTIKLTVPNMLLDVEVGLVPPVKDNAVIKILEGRQTQDVDITRQLGLERSGQADLHTGTYRMEFSNFKVYCEPKMYLKILDGTPHPPIVYFTAYYNRATSSQIEFKNVSYEGTGSKFITLGRDATIVVSKP